MKQNETEAMT